MKSNEGLQLVLTFSSFQSRQDFEKKRETDETIYYFRLDAISNLRQFQTPDKPILKRLNASRWTKSDSKIQSDFIETPFKSSFLTLKFRRYQTFEKIETEISSKPRSCRFAGNIRDPVDVRSSKLSLRMQLLFRNSHQIGGNKRSLYDQAVYCRC